MGDFVTNLVYNHLMTTVTRIAPSPTGNLHLGTVRTALYNVLFAKNKNGKFFFRLEDTDRERSTKEFEQEIIAGFKWLGIAWDTPEAIDHENGMVRQSTRNSRHQEIINILLDKKIAYKCYATTDELEELRKSQRAAKQAEGYDNRGRNYSQEQISSFEAENRKYVVRLNIGLDRDIKWDDLVRGSMSINTKDLGGDPIIQKFNGQVLYNFAVVADDNDMKVTHVIRGEDHLTNTAKQIAICEACSFNIPEFGHLPLIFTKDKQKLSKRKHGDIAGVDKYKNEGYLPEALVNYLVTTSYTDQVDSQREIYSLSEAYASFDHKGISKSPAIYDIQKLNWFNREYIAKLSAQQVLDACLKYLSFDLNSKFSSDQITLLIEAVRGNLDKFSDIDSEVSYFFERITIPENLQKFVDEGQDLLKNLVTNIKSDKYDFNNATHLKEAINKIGEEMGLSGKKLFFPIRIALSSRSGGPDLGVIMNLLGKTETLARLENSIN